MEEGSQAGLLNNQALKGSKNWQCYLWALPVVPVLAICLWHFSGPAIAHFKARQSWKRDKANLAVAYSRMDEANLKGDLNSWLQASMNANGNLDALRADLKELSSTQGQYQREQFLIGAEDCLKSGFDATPPPVKHSEYCNDLIGQR